MTKRAHLRGLCAQQPEYEVHLAVEAPDIAGAPAIYAGGIIIAAGGGDPDLAQERADMVIALLRDRSAPPHT